MWRALAMVALCAGCSKGKPSSDAVITAERFMDLYFVEIDQEKALGITAGPAHEILEGELEDVKAVRAGGYTPAEAKAHVYYERRYLKEEGDLARLAYDITIEHESDKTERNVLLSLRREGGVWRVTTFTVREGPAPKAP